MRLDKNQKRAATGRGREDRARRLVERSGKPVGAKHRQQHGKKAWQAVGGDIIGPKYRRRRGLQPVNSSRLLRPQFVLEPDGDKIAAFDHLAACLGKARLVTIHGRHRLMASQHRYRENR